MTTADSFRRLAADFTAKVEGTTDWEAPTPCEGWVARDVVAHLTGWLPGMFADVFPLPEAKGDPVADWAAVRDALQAALDDPELSSRTTTSQAGSHPVSVAVERFVNGDVLVHTWDLARATGQDETLDAEAVRGMYAGMLPMDEVIRSSGMFGPKVEVPEDASEQDKLLAFTGRDPRWPAQVERSAGVLARPC